MADEATEQYGVHGSKLDFNYEEAPERVRARLREIGDACLALANADPTNVPPRRVVRDLGHALLELAGAAKRYPDVPAYQRLLGTDDIPAVEPLNPDASVRLFMLSDTRLYSPDTERMVDLEGDTLWAFNTLAATRDEMLQVGDHMARDFRDKNPESRRKTFRYALTKMVGDLESILPRDTPILLETPPSRSTRRQLHPNIIIEDMRGNKAYAHLLEAPVPAQEIVVTEPLSMGKMASLSGASRMTVRDRLVQFYGVEEFALLGKDYEFPPEVAGPIINALRAERSAPLVPMPEGYTRVNLLVDQSGRRIDIIAAVRTLEQHGYHPVRLNIDPKFTSRGGIWVVEEAGALETLRTKNRWQRPRHEPASVEPAKEPATASAEPVEKTATEAGIAPAETTLAAAPPAEDTAAESQKRRVGLGRTSSVSDIVAYLAAKGIVVEPGDVTQAANAEPLVDKQAVDKDSYSFYAAKKIVAALGGPTPDLIG
jgi:hypothetical protein